eukprot:CAMPEP_0115066438 /NCGR_PEP_ID=MMETSP0227-20121206/10808_1 /TAXON_ID=89957 /ORGANISM="Polarella glacialis, Strain CCMP 1383" /LENGTH=56 /DNA_ID=CAMNT_0002452341 /DNA_START=465 /DNA_END=635 /DNA_ORIENTATION=+
MASMTRCPSRANGPSRPAPSMSSRVRRVVREASEESDFALPEVANEPDENLPASCS